MTNMPIARESRGRGTTEAISLLKIAALPEFIQPQAGVVRNAHESKNSTGYIRSRRVF